MAEPILNLVVIRCSDMERSSAFYTRLGLTFTRHRHGKGPEHDAAEMGGVVFELYPQVPGGLSTLGTRIGFRVSSLEDVIAALADFPETVVSPPKASEWGLRAVIADPDGHRIELIQSV
ncbi:MAG: VOC family protein [Luteolibacter sp.]